jgi:quinol monooxygenase YgiN
MSRLAVIARLELSAEDAPKYVAAARDMVGPTRREPGCDWYGMAVDIEDPGVIWVSEQWASKQALDDHLRSPHVRRFLEAIGDLDMRSIEARQYTVAAVGEVEMPE